MIQIGGVYTTLFQEEGILLQKYRDRNGRCIATLFKTIRVRGQFDSPEFGPRLFTLGRLETRGFPQYSSVTRYGAGSLLKTVLTTPTPVLAKNMHPKYAIK